MADLIYPNIAGSYQQGLGFGRQMRAEDTARRNQSRLSELAAQAYGSSGQDRQSAIQQAIGVDPQAGFALDQQMNQQEQAREAKLLRTARLLASAPDEYKASLYQQIYPQVAQDLPGLPPEWSPQVAQGIEAFIASRSPGGNLSDRFRVVGSSLVDLQDPSKPVFTAPEATRTILTDQGLVRVGPGGVEELRLGSGQPQGPTMTQESDGRQVDVSGVTDPAARAAILANPDAFAALPDNETVRAPGVVQQGQRIGPPVNAAQQQAMALALDSNRLANEAAARAQRDSDIRARFGTIPAGFRVNAAGTALEAVPGGPKPAGSAATEGERKAATLLKRMEGSLAQLETAVRENPDARSPSVAAEIGRGLPLIGEIAANTLNSQERQRVEAAQLDILDAALTLGTGAAYTREQLQGYRRSFFPQLGDTDATERDKAARLQNVIEAARIAAGRAAPAAGTPQAPQARPALPPGFSWED